MVEDVRCIGGIEIDEDVGVNLIGSETKKQKSVHSYHSVPTAW